MVILNAARLRSIVPVVPLAQSRAEMGVDWIGRKDTVSSEDRGGNDASPASCTPDRGGRMQRRKEAN